jgi:hypothetical protein
MAQISTIGQITAGQVSLVQSSNRRVAWKISQLRIAPSERLIDIVGCSASNIEKFGLARETMMDSAL